MRARRYADESAKVRSGGRAVRRSECAVGDGLFYIMVGGKR